MKNLNRKVYILGSQRIPFCRAGTLYAKSSIPDLSKASVNALVEKCDLKGKELGELAFGGVMNHTSDWNLARELVLASELDKKTPAFNVQKACATSLETVINLANKISLGQIDSGIAGGVDSISDLPINYSRELSAKFMAFANGKNIEQRLRPWFRLKLKDLKPQLPNVVEPTTGLSMGESCEIMAKNWKINRSLQDEFALSSHQKAAKAYEEGFFEDLVVKYRGNAKDNIVRGNTTLDKMASLKTVFDRSEQGTLTAANSSALTDGSAAVLLGTAEWAEKNNLPVLAELIDFQSAAIDLKDEGLLMAPAYAVPKLLARNELSLQDFDFYEIHEAFAAQVLCTLQAWESEDFCKNQLGLSSALGSIDQSKLNVKGGSIAIGHPFGATGSRIVGTLSKLLDQKGSGRGLISICTGGGMGVTAILQKS